MSMAQVGEFAFIVATLRLSLGVISPFLFPIAVGASAITTFTTPYMIKFSEPAYHFIHRRLPDYFKKALTKYAIVVRHLQAESRWKTITKAYLKILLTNGIVLLALNQLTVEVLAPFLDNEIKNFAVSRGLCLFISLVIATPFLWAFIVKRPEKIAPTELWLNKKYGLWPLLGIRTIRMALGILLVGFWIHSLFVTRGILVVLPFIIVPVIFFSKRVQRYYQKIELRFLDNLNRREILEKMKNINEAKPDSGDERNFQMDEKDPDTGKP